MATATKKLHARTPVARSARVVAEPAPLEFLVHQDNVGNYRWEIVDEGGGCLAQCGSFVSYADAERAARRVRDSAGSARFEPVSPNSLSVAAV